MGDMFGAMFVEPEPLTADQEARLPAAQAVVGQIFPEGTYAKLMEETMGPMMDGIFGQLGDMPFATLAQIGGIPADDVAAMGDTKLDEVMAIVDPAYKERNKAIGAVTVKFMGDLMNRIEPSYRAGLARAYAKRFEEAELAELQRFFATPVGSHYASESMLIMADPQVMSAMNEMMPAMFEMMPQMMEQMAAATADLPQMRSVEQLSAAEQEQLAGLFGITVEELRSNAAEAEVTEDAVEDAAEGTWEE